MDPTATLAELRSLAAHALAGQPVDIARMAELVASLDGWLVMGGALPDQWPARQHRPSEART